MPCPYFEPIRVVPEQTKANARLPLMEEYDGLCHAMAHPATAPRDMLYGSCNHGYSQGCCVRFPLHETRSALRYSVVSQNDLGLELLCVEESNYAPLRWYSIRYSFAGGCIEPVLSDACVTAQAAAFSRGYLKLLAA